MFSWITGPRITNVIEQTHTDPANDTTFIEPPDTPAHQFAVKAFKQALFGTPAPPERNTEKKTDRKAPFDAPNAKVTALPAPRESTPPASPSKQPNGVLRTPGTLSKGRKTVSFGAHVVDNEGKKGNVGKSGIPSDCPGKFPSPWTPGTELKADAASDSKPRTKLTAALYDARSTTQPKSGQKPKARDDSDITIDLGAPRSESGRYWKEQYETYAERSEKQMKQLVTKQQLAKNYAKKKDADAMEAATRLAEERRRFKVRERQLEQQNKDLQEQLRQALAEKTAAGVEITSLKNRVEALEKSSTSSDMQYSKMSFQIYEDSNKDSSHPLLEQVASDARPRDAIEPPPVLLGKPVSSRIPPEDKENSPPKPRRTRRQTLSHASPQPTASNPAAETTHASALLDHSPRTQEASELPSRTPLSLRKPQPSQENLPSKSPMVLPSSPLPVPSPGPDLWMDNDSPAPRMDRLALPISCGPSYARAPKSTFSRGRASKSVAHSTADAETHTAEHRATKYGEAKSTPHGLSQSELPKTTELSKENTAPKDQELEMAKPAIQQDAEGNRSHVGGVKGTTDADRKERAHKRLLERKKKRMETS